MFDSAKQKIDRAEYHIADLQRQFVAFIAEKPHRFVVKTDAQTGQPSVHVRYVKPVPPSFALVIGDAIHNLRCALDHMTWEAVGLNGTQNKHLKFPTGQDRVSFKSSCYGIVTPDQWVKDSICALEAFPGGKGDYLYEINALDNADKHTGIRPTVRASGLPPYTVTKPDGTVVHVEGDVFIGEFDHFPGHSWPSGSSIELDQDAECPPSIFIRKTRPGWNAEPAFLFLLGCTTAVSGAIASVEAAKPI
jgi:hypothetical protein